MFYDILERKNAFLSYKNKKLGSAATLLIFLVNIGQENVFDDILERIKRLSKL